MKLNISAVPDSDWDEYIALCDGNVYHCADWAEISKQPNSTPLFMVWRDTGDKVAAIAIGQLHESSAPLIGGRNGKLSLGSLPAARPEYRGRATQILMELKRFALQAGCRTVDVESHMCAQFDVDAQALGAISRGRVEFRLDLAPAEDRLWESLGRHHRRKIRKALKQDMEVRDSDAAGDAALLRELQKGSRDRRRARGEDMTLGDDAPVVNLMQRLLARGLGRLFLAEQGGRVISGALLSVYRGRAYYVFGGSNEQGFGLDAPGLIFWRMIQYYRKREFVELNLGGVPADAANPSAEAHGLYRFKAGFGTRQVSCADYSFDLRPALSLAIRLASRVLRRS